MNRIIPSPVLFSHLILKLKIIPPYKSTTLTTSETQMGLVTLKVVDTAIAAHILKSRLESEDIACYIFDENIVTLNPLFNFAVGGVKLKVNEQDLEKANGILSEIDNQPYTDNQDKVIKCPKCSSEDLYSDFKSMKDVKGIMATITAFLFMVFPIYYKSVYKCKKCDHEFKPEEGI